MKANLIRAGLGALLALVAAWSCEKTVDNSMAEPKNSHLDLYLTDAPGAYQAVWVNLEKVMVNTGADSSGEDGWTEVPLLRPGLYNLLDFRNGEDTILGAVDLPAGEISQLRLVLGDGNYLVLEDSSEVPLSTPSAEESGLKLNLHAELEAGIPYALVLDFDAARSVVKAGNSGQYNLKPVIRTFAKAAGGAMEGVVLPDSAGAHVLAITGADTLGAIPDASGYYKFWGVPAGSYSLQFLPDSASGFVGDTLEGISVETGEVTQVDTVWLSH